MLVSLLDTRMASELGMVRRRIRPGLLRRIVRILHQSQRGHVLAMVRPVPVELVEVMLVSMCTTVRLELVFPVSKHMPRLEHHLDPGTGGPDRTAPHASDTSDGMVLPCRSPL